MQCYSEDVFLLFIPGLSRTGSVKSITKATDALLGKKGYLERKGFPSWEVRSVESIARVCTNLSGIHIHVHVRILALRHCIASRHNGD